jgi:hypothetical protein
LGLNEDGRAPVATFGARIQLAYLTGLLPKEALPLFRGMKELRNLMAHRVNVSLLGDKAQRALGKLRSDLAALSEGMAAAGERSRTDEEAARKLVLFTFAALSYGLKMQHENITRLVEIWQE